MSNAKFKLDGNTPTVTWADPKSAPDHSAASQKWRQEFKVSELSEELVKNVAQTGKAYVHDFLDVNDRPVLIVVVSKHFPAMQDPAENEKLCVLLIEKALGKLPAGKEELLGIFDLRGFSDNTDLNFLTFLEIATSKLDNRDAYLTSSFQITI